MVGPEAPMQPCSLRPSKPCLVIHIGFCCGDQFAAEIPEHFVESTAVLHKELGLLNAFAWLVFCITSISIVVAHPGAQDEIIGGPLRHTHTRQVRDPIRWLKMYRGLDKGVDP